MHSVKLKLHFFSLSVIIGFFVPAIFLALYFWGLLMSSSFIVRQSYEGFTALNIA